jgi:hypothetical protein
MTRPYSNDLRERAMTRVAAEQTRPDVARKRAALAFGQNPAKFRRILLK